MFTKERLRENKGIKFKTFMLHQRKKNVKYSSDRIRDIFSPPKKKKKKKKKETKIII